MDPQPHTATPSSCAEPLTLTAFILAAPPSTHSTPVRRQSRTCEAKQTACEPISHCLQNTKGNMAFHAPIVQAYRVWSHHSACHGDDTSLALRRNAVFFSASPDLRFQRHTHAGCVSKIGLPNTCCLIPSHLTALSIQNPPINGEKTNGLDVVHLQLADLQFCSPRDTWCMDTPSSLSPTLQDCAFT